MARFNARHGQDRWNNRYAVVLAVFPVLSAVPLASNRPVWWLFCTAVIGLFGAGYHLLTLKNAPQRVLRVKPFAGLFLMAMIVPVYAVLQAQNLVGVLPTGGPEMPSRTISIVPDASLIGALRFFGYLILLALVIEVATRRDRVNLMTKILFVGITLQAVWALIALKLLGDAALWGEKRAYLGMATGSFINRNSLATFLGFGLVLGAALIGTSFAPSHSRRVWGRMRAEAVLVMMAMFVILLALLATQSRLGIFASSVGLLVTAFLLVWRHGALSVRAGAIIGFATLAFGASLIVFGQGAAERILFSEGDSATRLALYRQIIGMIELRPLTGIGFDGFGPAFEAHRAPPLNSDLSFQMAHNTYLALWSELGLIVGTIPPLLLLITALLCVRRLRAEDGFPTNAAAAIGAIVLGAIHSLGDFSLEIPANNYVFLVILGLGVAQRRSRALQPATHTDPDLQGRAT